MTLAKCDDRFRDSLLYPFEKGQIFFSTLDRKLADLAQNSGYYCSRFQNIKKEGKQLGEGCREGCIHPRLGQLHIGIWGRNFFSHTQNTTDLINNVGNLFSYFTHTKHFSSVSRGFSSSKLQSALLLKITVIDPLSQMVVFVALGWVHSTTSINGHLQSDRQNPIHKTHLHLPPFPIPKCCIVKTPMGA